MTGSIDSNPNPSTRSISLLPTVALFLALVALVWSDPLFVRRGFAGRDLLAYNLPMEKSIHDAYARGEWPVWNPEISGGRPLLPNPNAGALYPVRMLLAPLRFPLAAKLFPILHWAAGGVGVVLLLSLLGASRGGAWLGAVTYAFSGVVVSQVYYPHVLPGMALLPWILWAMGRPARPARRVALLSVLLALDLLAADVFSIGLALLAAILWIVCEDRGEARRQSGYAFAAAGALALLAALPQIVATGLWIPQTHRAISGITLGEALHFCVSPYRLLELVIPYPFGSVWTVEDSSRWAFSVYRGSISGLFLTLYVGAVGVVALVTMLRSRVRGASLGRALVILSLVLTVPGSLLPAAWEGWRSPIALRNPEKFAVALALGLAILAGLAWDELRRRARLPRWILVVGVALTGAAVLATALPELAARFAVAVTGTPADLTSLAAGELPRSLAEGALLWIVTALALEVARAPGPRGGAIGLAILTAVSLAATRRIPGIFREEEIFAPPAFVRYLWKQDPEGRFRTLGERIYRAGSEQALDVHDDPGHTEYTRHHWTAHAQALWERGSVFNDSFDNGDLSRMDSLRTLAGVAARYRDGDKFFSSLALRWGIRFRNQVPVPGYHRVGGEGLWDWDENPDALPDIRLVSGWTEASGPVAALSAIPRLTPGEVVIETGSSGRGAAAGGGEIRVRVAERSPAHWRLATTAPAPTWLFALSGFWPYRSVSVDDHPVEVFPAQLAFSAIRIPAGDHSVEWREQVPGWSVSRAGPWLYLLGVAALWLRRDRSRRP